MTILCDKFTGQPKGYEYVRWIVTYLTLFLSSFAYVEFADKDSVQTALALDDSLFKGRQIKVRCYLDVITICMNEI